jgi:hypothetical protein
MYVCFLTFPSVDTDIEGRLHAAFLGFVQIRINYYPRKMGCGRFTIAHEQNILRKLR